MVPNFASPPRTPFTSQVTFASRPPLSRTKNFRLVPPRTLIFVGLMTMLAWPAAADGNPRHTAPRIDTIVLANASRRLDGILPWIVILKFYAVKTGGFNPNMNSEVQPPVKQINFDRSERSGGLAGTAPSNSFAFNCDCEAPQTNSSALRFVHPEGAPAPPSSSSLAALSTNTSPCTRRRARHLSTRSSCLLHRFGPSN